MQPGRPLLPPPPPKRSPATLIIIVAVAAVLLLVVAGAGIFLFVNRDRITGSGGAHRSARPSYGPIYRKLPSCDTMPATAFASLMPGGMLSSNVHRDGTEDDGPNAICQWDNIDADNKQPPEDRIVHLTMNGYSDYFGSPFDAAKKALATDRSDSDGVVGKTDHSFTYGPVTELSGLGTGAFAQNYTVTDGFPRGGTGISLQVENVVVELSFEGGDGEDDQEHPMDPAKASQAAMAVAHDVVAWLASCADCKS
ncbi:MAG TPA: hypothetical protein VGJ07_15425 [Rugosimonospora sp.]|jgi:hypothetical protein